MKRRAVRYVRIKIDDLLDAAMASIQGPLPILGRKINEQWMIQSAIQEGLFAMADFEQEHGHLRPEFRLEVNSNKPRRMIEHSAAMEAVEAVLAKSQEAGVPNAT